MKILCVSDMVDPFIYTSTIKTQFSDVSAVLCAGDLPMDYIDFIVSTLNKPTYFIFGNHNLKEYKYYHPEVKSSSVISYSNSATAAANRGHGAIYAGFQVFRDPSLMVIDRKTGKTRPLLLAGVSGSREYNHGQAQFTEMEMKWHLIKMIPSLLFNKLRWGTYLDIFLTHATPRHIHDHEDPCHKGFKCFNSFIEKYKPTFMVHGHIHLYDQNEERCGFYGSTNVVNAYGHHIIELESPEDSEKKQLKE